MKHLPFVLAPLLLAACDHGPSAPAQPTKPPTTTSAVQLAKALPEPSPAEIKLVADSFLQDWIQGSRHAAYTKMGQVFRQATSEAQFGTVVDGMNKMFGNVLDAEYKSAEIGTNFSFAGIKKQWTLIYAVRTSTTPKGKYFAKIDLVADPHLGIQSFQIMTFPLGRVPPNLQ